MENNNEKKSEIKVVILGCSNSGKSSLIRRYTFHTFIEDSPPTGGGSLSSKMIEIGDKSLILNIWDTAGAKNYLPFNSYYFQNAEAIVLVYDIISKDNFNGLKEYWEEIIKPNISSETSKKKINL